MKVIHYGRQSVNQQDVAAVVKVLRSDFLTQGKVIKKFEETVARYSGARYAVAVSSGTAALHAAMAVIGLKPGDEVIVPPLSFAATANCVLYRGARPVFADVVYEAGLLDPREVEKKISKRTKAIITVDYSGQASYFKELKKIAREHQLVLVDDASHSLGSRFGGKPIGNQADITIFSFHPVKTITSGEGGMLVTSHHRYWQKADRFRTHGITKNPKRFVYKRHRDEPGYQEMQDLGFNYRLTEILAALALSQLKRIDRFLSKRRKIAHLYHCLLKENNNFKTYQPRPGCQSSWHLYPLRITNQKIKKKAVFDFLKKNRVVPQVHYLPIHLHPYYRQSFGLQKGDFPQAEQFYQEEISLPIYYRLKLAEVRRVASLLNQIQP